MCCHATINYAQKHTHHSFLSTRTSTLNMLNSIYAQKHTQHSFLLTDSLKYSLYAKQHFLCSKAYSSLFFTDSPKYSLYAKQHFYAKQHNTHHTFLFHSPSTLMLNSIITIHMLNSIITLHMLTAFQHVYVIKTRISLITSL